MSILKKPYEISIWEDEWNESEFVEKKLGIIGSDTMQFQGRAIEPNLIKNVNGVKKFSFKMYHKFVDTVTGEKIDNPFADWLISERKVKLKYDGEWYDFIIKNVTENSTNYLYTYQLEDALVQELSKNGFGIALDEKIIDADGNSNIGTANELASRVLENTDWSVDENSEAFVQTIDEALVYLTLPDELSGLDIKHIKDQTDWKTGVVPETVDDNQKDLMKGKTILGFYSSCTNKPHRFQFIYVSDLANLERDENRYIKNDDCQYYIDYEDPNSNYDVTIASLGLFLPKGFKTATVDEDDYGYGVTLSSKYRGKRYGFSQQSRYIPVLDRYVNLYTDSNETPIYGYQHVEYKSPAFTQNMISNSSFDSTSGWTGTHNGEGTNKATVENVYGRFVENDFVDSIADLQNGSFEDNINNYKAYLKITFPNDKARVINSGPYDNRILIGNIDPNEKWALRFSCAGQNELNGSNFLLGEYKYDPASGGYKSIEGSKIRFNSFQEEGDYYITQATSSSYSNEEFKQSNLRLCIAPPVGVTDAVYYLEKIELFEATYNGNILITPEEQGEMVDDRVIDKTYYYFYPSRVANITSADQLVPDYMSKTLTYETYKPVYNEGAQKVRSITVKESNYFNILQSIAETFEAWLVLNISRDPTTGAIDRKTVCFKNYIGENNYAGFRYGVNLKDIQRTYESKNIVTKLIVKQNSNEHAENGFCTIARAGANPTGENYIYDFQYFFNTGLLNAKDYLETTYVQDEASGSDVGGGTLNLNGYFPRIKRLNNLIEEKSEILSNTAKDLTQYKAKLKMAETGEEAAISGTEQAEEDFLSFTGFTVQEVFGDTTITDITLSGKKGSNEDAKEGNGYYYRQSSWLQGDLTIQLNEEDKSISITGTAKEPLSSKETIYVDVYPKLTLSNGTIKVVHYSIACAFEEGSSTGSGNLVLYLADTENTWVKKLYKEYSAFRIKKNNYKIDKENQQSNVNSTQAIYDDLKEEIDGYLGQKQALNKLFFSQYSRFIQEGTWINEEYVDDEKYYADAQSVMYNSCYPQVAYSINVLELSKLPGYEAFSFKLGDKTYAEDPEFFGEGKREKVTITELSENLDDPSKNQIRVQNFKNQFQDLFQKITATVQQTQYSTGSYEKAVALAEANQARKQEFLTDALDSASARLSAAGQQSVTWGNDGITVKSVNSPCDAIRMVGGAILLSKQDENGEQKWVTGVTSDGVSANLITAGTINVNDIKIMNADEPVFKWDTFGISAYDAVWYNSDIGKVVSNIDTKKFVRYDKYGIYGINNAGVDGENWSPEAQSEIDEKATFALTWDGLKVTGENGGIARIGKQGDSILKITNQSGDPTFIADENGNVTIRGNLQIGDGTPVMDAIQVGGRNLLKHSEIWEYHSNDTSRYPIAKERISENGKSFYRFQRYKLNPDLMDEETGKSYNTLYGKIISLYNIINPEDLTEDIKNKQVTLSFWARGNEDRTLRFAASVFNLDEGQEETDLEGSYCDIDITTEWKKYSLTTEVPSAYNKQGLRFGPTSYFDGREKTEVWGFQLDVRQLKIESGSIATDWTFAPEDLGNGLNLLIGSEKTVEGTNEFLQYMDIAPVFDEYGIENWYAISFDIKTSLEGEGLRALVYCQNGSKSKFDIEETYVPVTSSFTRQSFFFKPRVKDSTEKTSMLAFYGNYETGNILSVKNVKIEKGCIATPWDQVQSTAFIAQQTANSKMDPNASGNFSWSFNKDTGMKMWSGERGTGDPSTDTNLMFKIDKSGANGSGKLWMRGEGEFTGIIFAQAGGTIGGWNITSGSLENGGLYLGTVPKKYTIGGTSRDNIVFKAGDNFGVDSLGALYATAGTIAGWEIMSNCFKYNPNNVTNSQGNGWVGAEGTALIQPEGTVETYNIAGHSDQWIFTIGENFGVTKDGILYTNGGQFTGTIKASGGEIGNLFIDGTGIIAKNSSDEAIMQLGSGGFVISEGYSLAVGNVVFEEKDGVTYSYTSGEYRLQAKNNSDTVISELVLGKQSTTSGDQTVRYLKLYFVASTGSYVLPKAKVQLRSYDSHGNRAAVPQKIGLTFYWRNGPYGGNWEVWTESLRTVTLYILPNNTGSDEVELSASGVIWGTPRYAFSKDKAVISGLTGSVKDTTSSDLKNLYLLYINDDNIDNQTQKPIWDPDEKVSFTNVVSYMGVTGSLYSENSGSLGSKDKPWGAIYSKLLYYNTGYGDQDLSDQRFKHSIDLLTDNYETFFNKIEPVKYKYNNGTSDRYHTGFIAQQLVKALSDSELTTKDFAGVMLHEPGTENECWYLRRDEFVALNTWQIQKLKPRMTSAEEKLVAYEARISALETEIKNLKSSQNSDII